MYHDDNIQKKKKTIKTGINKKSCSHRVNNIFLPFFFSLPKCIQIKFKEYPKNILKEYIIQNITLIIFLYRHCIFYFAIKSHEPRIQGIRKNISLQSISVYTTNVSMCMCVRIFVEYFVGEEKEDGRRGEVSW